MPATFKQAFFVAVTAGLGYGFDSYAVNIYGLVLPDIKKTLHITEAHAGYIGSIFLLGYAIGTIGFGFPADRWGRKTTLGASILLYGMTTALAGLTTNIAAFTGLRFLTGVGGAGELAVGAPYTAEVWPAKTRAIGVGGGHRLVVRNGTHASRDVLSSAGSVPVVAPRVNDKRVDPETGERQRFSSAILPAWARKTPQIEQVLPLLYLHGLSTGDFVPALGQFLGSAKGLSASVITKLTETWKAEQQAFAQRDLSSVDYVYLWADGIHVNVRLDETKLCLLVLIGVRTDGRKELVALTDGYREASESWADLLRDCRRRGMRAPVLAVGDGALGFWGALREVFPKTREQRCWFHKISNVLAALPKSTHPGAKKALAEIWSAEDKAHALDAVKAFEAAYGAKFPKAVAKITDDLDQLLAFYDFPAEHWVHLRTTNPIESTFATVRSRSKITKGPGSRAAGIAMAYKLIEAAQSRWRAVNAPHLVALVRAGARFENGKLVERPDEPTTEEAAA